MMKWYNRIWMRGIEEVVTHPLAAVSIAAGLGWSVTRAVTWELLTYTTVQTATFGWRLTSGSAEIIGRHAGKAGRPVAASLWSRTRVVAASPITWGVALAVAGTAAQANVMAKHGGGVRGTGTFGVSPSLHLKEGKPWWM